MEKKLNEKFEGPSLERIRKAAEELKGVGGESKKENPQAVTSPELSDLTQERLKLEKILQEINNLKGKICQRIGLLKMLEKGKKEIERAPNFLEETKNKLDNLKGHIK